MIYIILHAVTPADDVLGFSIFAVFHKKPTIFQNERLNPNGSTFAVFYHFILLISFFFSYHLSPLFFLSFFTSFLLIRFLLTFSFHFGPERERERERDVVCIPITTSSHMNVVKIDQGSLQSDWTSVSN